ncbi:MAG: hypothetical protein ABIW76_22885 [Fibrobacteria bacterium]
MKGGGISMFKTLKFLIGGLVALLITQVGGQPLQAIESAGGYVTCIVDHQNSIFAGTWGGGVYRSESQGTTWKRLRGPAPTNWVTSLVSAGPNLFAGTSEGFYKSTDQGQTWVLIKTGSSSSSTNAVGYQKGFLFVQAGGDLLRSGDLGVTWTLCLSGSDFISFAGNDRALFVGNYDGLMRSLDSGRTWTGLNGVSGWAYGLIAVGQEVYAASSQDGGIFISRDNGETWEKATQGVASNEFLSIAFSGASLFAGTGGHVYRSDDRGETWMVVKGLPLLPMKSIFADDSLVLIGTDYGGIFRSVDGGKTWTPGNEGLVETLPFLVELPKDSTRDPRPSLRWHPVPGALRYELQVSLSPDFSDFVHKAIIEKDTTYSFRNDLPFDTLYWQVYAFGSLVYSGGDTLVVFSGKSSFVELGPSVPIHASPPRYSKTHARLSDHPFRWRKVIGASSYGLEIGPTRSLDSTYIVRNLTDTAFLVDERLPVGWLYWHVLSDIDPAYSEVDSFFLQPEGTPLLRRKSGATFYPSSLSFGWGVEKEGEYRFQISSSITFQSVGVDTILKSESIQLYLPTVGTYFWRVGTGVNPNAYSPPDSFRLDTVNYVGIDKKPRVITPKPAMNIRIINGVLNVELEVVGYLSLRAVSGKILYQETLRPGRHRFTAAGGHLAPGIVIATLRLKDGLIVGKTVITP